MYRILFIISCFPLYTLILNTSLVLDAGWLVFSGKKHEDYDADELIAIVYDGSYEIDLGKSIPQN